ncbi:prepilin-type N-terminal cleavage/methylation domain-containing protein [Stutzerimonas zhaodongensis]|uniref:prepilin-type N-terminal cleavage/methylation domain-containing protein n=1 Tax=Stutzerimonas TaxID=2901164 RepID=UPI00388F43A1
MSRAGGFTLLELMLVLLIAGLVTAMSVAWLARGETLAADALQRLAERASALELRARDTGQLIGLGWSSGGPARFESKLQDGSLRWLATPLDKSWPEQVQPRHGKAGEPWVVFTPTGVARAMTVDWEWPDGHERWRWSSDGSLHVER